MASPAVLRIDIVTDASKASRGFDQTAAAAQRTAGKFSTFKQTAAGVFSGALFAKAASAAKDFFSESINKAVAAEEANRRLARTLGNLGFGKQTAEAKSFLDAMSKQAAVGKSELRPAFETLLRGTKNFGQAQQALKVALDTSAGSGKPLATVAQAITRAYQGNTGALGRLGIQTKATVPNLAKIKAASDAVARAQLGQIAAVKKYGPASDQAKVAGLKLLGAHEKLNAAQSSTKKSTLGVAAVMADLGKTFKGQAADQANSTAGKMKNLSLQMDSFKATVGAAVLPILVQLGTILANTVLPVLTTLAGWMKSSPGLFQLLVGAIVAVVAVVKGWAIAQAILNSTMLANPVFWIVLGIVALIAAVVLLVKNWDKVVAVLKLAWSWIVSNWPILLTVLLGPFGFVLQWVIRNWSKITDALGKVLGWISTAWSALYQTLIQPFVTAWSAIARTMGSIKNTVAAAFDWIWGKVKGVADAISGVVGGIADTARRIAEAVKGPINAVLRAWNGLEFKVPEVNVGPIHFGGQTIGMPNIPLLAQGGYVARTGLALVHRGETFSGVGRALPGSTVINVNVTTTGLGADAPQIQRAVVNALRAYTSRNGPLDVPVRLAG